MNSTLQKLFLIILVYLPLYSESDFECISLGAVCSTAAAFQAFNLRNSAHPFDWVISHFSALHSTIADDFKDYLNPEYFTIRGDNHGIINKYGIVFVHDFPTIHYTENNIQKEDLVNEGILSPEWLKALPFIQDKYKRRINRFITKCNSKNRIYLFRHFEITRNEAIELRNLIELKYPDLDFVLVVVGDHRSYTKKWGEQKIQNYYLNDTQVWNDVKEWKRIFIDLGILADAKTSINVNVKEYAKNLCGRCVYCQKLLIQAARRVYI